MFQERFDQNIDITKLFSHRKQQQHMQKRVQYIDISKLSSDRKKQEAPVETRLSYQPFKKYVQTLSDRNSSLRRGD